MENIKKKLLEEADKSSPPEFPPLWAPQKEGDYIFGIIRDIRTPNTRFGPRTIVEIETENGERRSVWISHATLKRQWNAKNPEVGDYILILYKGAKKTSTGKVQYHMYGLSVEKAKAPTPAVTEEKPEVKPEEKPEEKVEEKPEEKPSEIKIPKEKQDEIKKFVVDMFGFYTELTDEELLKLLKMRGYDVDINEVIALCKLKRNEKGKLTL